MHVYEIKRCTFIFLSNVLKVTGALNHSQVFVTDRLPPFTDPSCMLHVLSDGQMKAVGRMQAATLRAHLILSYIDTKMKYESGFI